jgi:Cys-tRNA(Pro)/Cys-tRNA(Cys) deacylase
MAKNMVKTNAMRMLEKAKIPYNEYTYEPGDSVDGLSVVAKLGQDPRIVFKTLVTQGKSHQYYVFVIPVAEELNLKAASSSVGEKSVEMIPVKDLNRVTGYIRGGCSPVGMKKQFQTVIDESALMLPEMIVSGGKIGFQIGVSPTLLAEAIGGKFAPITQ